MRSLTRPPYPIISARKLTRRALRAGLAGALLAVVASTAAHAAGVVDIRGGGYGHGVGMSQYGAEGYALHGADYRAILAHYYSGTALGTTDPKQVVRVLVGTGRASFTGATRAGHAHLKRATRYTVTATRTGRLRLRTAAGRSLGTFRAPLVASGSGPLRVPGAGTYRGTLQFTPAAGRGVDTVDAVGLDDYVRGVVAAEMPASWAPAALEAQAVAARTYAITTGVGARAYDLYDDTRSQVYRGVGAETAATDAAVAATTGQIVTYAGRPAVTYFFSSSGGYTESVQDAWPGAAPEPWLRAVPDPYDDAAGDPYHRWSVQVGLPTAAAKLSRLVRGSLVGVGVVGRGTSGRITSARIVGTRGQTTVTGAQLQSLFGLDSTLATFTTITTQDPPGRLTGTIFPVPQGPAAIQRFASGRWQTVAQAAVSPAGHYAAWVPAGRYRITTGGLDGPVVAVPKVRLSRVEKSLAFQVGVVAPRVVLLALQSVAARRLPGGPAASTSGSSRRRRTSAPGR